MQCSTAHATADLPGKVSVNHTWEDCHDSDAMLFQGLHTPVLPLDYLLAQKTQGDYIRLKCWLVYTLVLVLVSDPLKLRKAWHARQSEMQFGSSLGWYHGIGPRYALNELPVLHQSYHELQPGTGPRSPSYKL